MKKMYFFSDDSCIRYDMDSGKVDAGYPRKTAENWSGLAETGFGAGVDAAVSLGNGKLYLFRQDQYVSCDIASETVDPGYPRSIAENWRGFDEAGFGTGIDAAVYWGLGKAFFYQGGRYVRYDVAAGEVDAGYPLHIGKFRGFAEAGFEAGVSSAVNTGDGKVLFFRGDQYLRYNVDNVSPDYPRSIGENWRGFAEAGFDGGIDAAVNWGNGKVYVFRGDRYLRYDIAADRVDPDYPRSIGENWRGFAEAGFDGGIDAAVNWGNGKVYVFRGDRYLRYDIAADRVDPDYPRSIGENWRGFAEAGFDGGIDAAVNWGNGKVYVFRGDRYLRYDIAADRVDPDYPHPIAKYLPGLAGAGLGSDIGATAEWGDGKIFFFKGSQYVKYEMDGVDSGFPALVEDHWRGLPDGFNSPDAVAYL